MKFTVTIAKGGASHTEIIEAASRFEVYDRVQQEGGAVTNISEASAHGGLPSWLFISFGTGVKRQEVIQFAKNLAAMLAAGLSLSRALSVIVRQSKNKSFRKIVDDLADRVKKGSSFHDALGAYPAVFSNLFRAMTKAGEESGSLTESLTTVGKQMENSAALIRKVRGAMIYPSIVITAIIIVGVLMLIFVVPTLTHTFEELHVQVPMTTQIIVAISDFLVGNILLVLGGIALLVLGGIALVRTDAGRSGVLAVALRLPVVGELVRETYTARAARTLSSLLSAGVPVLDALAITRDVVHARVFARVFAEAETLVRKGEPLSKAFTEHEKLYPILMSDMLAVGEETGKVAEMLGEIATFYEGDVSEKTKDLSTIIEPVLMLLIGAGVGVFAVSMIAPIYSLSSAF